MDIREQKQALRKKIRQEMQPLPPSYFQQAGKAICQKIITTDAYRQSDCVFCFVSCGKEPDTYPLLNQILSDGKVLAVPLCRSEGQMELRRITALSQLAPGAYNIPEPPEDAPLLPPADVQLALIPCLAATRDGKRLGKGGGYYDRFLATYTGAVSLLCPQKLIQDDIPLEPHDILIPHVITE